MNAVPPTIEIPGSARGRRAANHERHARDAAVCGDVALAGCVTHHDSGPDGDPDPDPSHDPNCHFDCFGAIECRAGHAIAWAHEPVPCAEWTGQCPHVAVACAGGCALEFHINEVVAYAWQSADRLRALCAEAPPAMVGDRCEEGSCVPIHATTAGDGTATLSYLACALTTRTCAITDPPQLERYLAACSQGPSQLSRDAREGVVDALSDRTFDLPSW